MDNDQISGFRGRVCSAVQGLEIDWMDNRLAILMVYCARPYSPLYCILKASLPLSTARLSIKTHSELLNAAIRNAALITLTVVSGKQSMINHQSFEQDKTQPP